MSTPSVRHCALLLLSSSVAVAVAADECRPVTWQDSNLRLADMMTTAPSRPIATYSVPDKERLEVGDVNCRFWDQTYEQANYYSCKRMANENSITIETFFMLNPEVDEHCSNVRPHTKYCVEGFLEPLRAYADGKCGPQNNNATCMSSGHGDCCNSETWTCGDTPADCAIGVCYEGDCWGHNFYTTDGSCGYIDGYLRKCGGKWGDCCDMTGRCGTGEAFCGDENCAMGECDRKKVSATTTSTSTTTRTTTTTGSMTSTSSSASASATWVPQGCYKDLAPDTVRPLPNRLINGGNSLTIQSCQAACYGGGYTMAGVENGNQCFCGYDIQEPDKNIPALESDCAKPCVGDSTQTCGDRARVFLYRYAVPKQQGWQALGCYKDMAPTTPRPLPNRQSGSSVTIEGCQSLCRGNTSGGGTGYSMAGVEDGNQCFCGSSIQDPANNAWVTPDECSKPCTGNRNQTCGDRARMYIYQYAVPERKVWRSVGCYKDMFPNAARTLDTILRSGSNMTIESCHSLCQESTSAYRYAGLENGNQCWCGNDIRDPAINTLTAQSECSTPCTGNRDQTCGRSARMHIYEYVSA